MDIVRDRNQMCQLWKVGVVTPLTRVLPRAAVLLDSESIRTLVGKNYGLYWLYYINA